MSQTRKLAAIMFTDIKGYTSLMQSDEAQAIKLRKRHREVFEHYHQIYNGTILQYYGDGTLSIFDSALDAAKCSIEIQKDLIKGEPYIPLRIGLHTGDIIYSETEAIGDGVNVASRVESLAEAGSVMISDKFYDYVKNQKEVSIAPMGSFQFKNVQKPMEVFALEAEGLVVPNPKDLKGKFQKRHGKSWLKTALERKIPQIVGSYLLVVGLLAFALGYLANSYEWPAYTSTLVWTFFLSLLPSVLVYAYHHGKTAEGPWTLTEKLTIPTNLAMAGILAFTIFSNQELQAATETISVEMEDGAIIKKTIVKSDHQKKFYVTNFDNKADTTLHDWMSIGIPFALEMDWDQDPYIMNMYEEDKEFPEFGEQINAAQEQNCPMLLTGSFEMADSGYYVYPKLYDTKTGQLIKDWDFYGKNLFELLDKISLKIKQDLAIPEEHIQEVLDYPVAKQLTNSLDAYELFCDAMVELRTRQFGKTLAYLDRAVGIDSTFAMANYYRGMFNHQLSISARKAKEAADQAMVHRKRLSETMETNVRILNYKIAGEDDKVAKLGKMMAELRPNSPDLQLNLAIQYRLMDRYEDALEAVKKYQVLTSDPKARIGLELYLLNRLGRTKEGLKIGNKLLKENPENLASIKEVARLYLSQKNYEQAEALYERASLLDPDNKSWENFLQHTKFMKDSADVYSDDLRDAYQGSYKIEIRDVDLNIIAENNSIFLRLKNQPRAELYPMSKNSFVAEFTGGILKFEQNPSGETDRFVISEVGSPFFKCFKQTEEIENVYKLIREGQYAELERIIPTLIEKHPSHYYLPIFNKHASYMLKNSSLTPEDWKAYIGKYNVKHLTAEVKVQDGIAHLEFPASGATFEFTPLYPIDKDEFIVLTGFQHTYKFKHKGSKIVQFDLMTGEETSLSLEKVE